MPRFFLPGSHTVGDLLTVTGEDAHHIARSLRMAVGDRLTLSDTVSSAYECTIEAFRDDREVDLRVLKAVPLEGEPPYEAVLYQALPKGDKMDTVIQKAVECGAFRIVPFESANCTLRVRDDIEDKKTERRNRISSEAAKQCRRGILPEVTKTVSFSEALLAAKRADLALFCYEDSEVRGDSLHSVLTDFKRKDFPAGRKPVIAVFVGSEGGFTPAEAARALEAGCRPVSLGVRILRTETAGSFTLACLSYVFELPD